MEYTLTLPENFESMDLASLLETVWLVPRKVRHFLRTRRNVLVNNQVLPFHEQVNAGDIITLIFEDTDYKQPEIALGSIKNVTVLFEDDHLIIVNKPYGMKTHPNTPEEKHTLLNHVAAYLEPVNQLPYVVHRLDKDTSGAIVFAKNPFILPILGRMLEAKDITRIYQALVSGQLDEGRFTINKKITTDRHDKRKRIVSTTHGQEAITHVTVEKSENNQAYVLCVLETGRTHQIRVHLESIGHPIMGDTLYNPRPQQAPRLMLHAKTLQLVHPFTNELITVQAEPGLW